jgi:hypothetical protein
MAKARKAAARKTARPRGPQVRIPLDLYQWADAHAHSGDRGLRSATDVVVQALRDYRDAEELRTMRRALFQAWVDAGRKGPLPPGLTSILPQE